MKPAPFEYRRAASLDEAVRLLEDDDAKILAGGQSLVAMMNLRLARPSTLIDLTAVRGLASIHIDEVGLRVGALARHVQVEEYPSDLGPWSVLQRAARWIGHYPIRTQGTFGGSIAHGDPAAEWCILAVLFDAEVVVVGPEGSRSIPAREFFRGYFMTALEQQEIVTEVRFPSGARHAALTEFAKRRGDFAIVATAVAFEQVDGALSHPRIALGGVATVPVRMPEVEELLEGAPAEPATWARAADLIADSIDPPSDNNGSSDYRRTLSAGLVRRAFEEASGRADFLPGTGGGSS